MIDMPKKIILVIDADKYRPHGLADKIAAKLDTNLFHIERITEFTEAARWISQMTYAPVAIVTDETQTGSMNGYQFIDLVRNEHPELAKTPIYFLERTSRPGPVPYTGVQGHYLQSGDGDEKLVGDLLRHCAAIGLIKYGDSEPGKGGRGGV